jgi:hypothetical protein
MTCNVFVGSRGGFQQNAEVHVEPIFIDEIEANE